MMHKAFGSDSTSSIVVRKDAELETDLGNVHRSYSDDYLVSAAGDQYISPQAWSPPFYLWVTNSIRRRPRGGSTISDISGGIFQATTWTDSWIWFHLSILGFKNKMLFVHSDSLPQ